MTGKVFVPQDDLKFTAKLPARLLTDTILYLTGPPPSPRDSEKTAMSGQLLVVAVTRAGPFTLTLMMPEPPPAGMDNELSLTDSTQRPSPGRRSDSSPAEGAGPAAASTRRGSADGALSPGPFGLGAARAAGARSLVASGAASGD